MKVTFPVIIDTIRSMKDKSVKITIETREFSPDESAVLFSLRGQEAWALFAPAPLKEDDLPDGLEYEETTGKSKSQRLRNCLYVWWQQQGGLGDFKMFYEEKMETIINKIKEKLV